MFFCIGAHRAGTAWLHRQLANHPQVSFPLRRETHFWDRYADGLKKEQDLQSYCQAMHGTCEVLCGDMTTSYALLDEETIGTLRGHFPDARIVYILRDPASRAWSAARQLMAVAHLEQDEINQAWLAAVCRSEITRKHSNYRRNLRAWQRHFDAKQILLLDYAEMRSDPRGFLCLIAQHLGIDARPFETRNVASLGTWVGKSPAFYQTSPAMGLELKSVFAEQRHEMNQLLSGTSSRGVDSC